MSEKILKWTDYFPGDNAIEYIKCLKLASISFITTVEYSSVAKSRMEANIEKFA